MIRLCKYNQENILDKIRSGQLDAVALSTTNLIDDIILKINSCNIFNCLEKYIPDFRADNTTIPYKLIWASAIAAKMRVQTSLTDIPYALNDHKTLAELGYTLIDDSGNLKNGLMQEGSLRFLLGKYDAELFINGYIYTIQKGILPLLNIEPNIHILDCTDLEVNFKNSNYEMSGISHSKRDNKLTRGYKLATLRGIVKDVGLIEDIRFGSIQSHDLNLSEEMVRTSPVLKPGDILINDRGFMSRELMNFLKVERNVDTYIPLRKNMVAYQQAILSAKEQNIWKPHPNFKRKNQVISLVEGMRMYWDSDTSENDVPINTCVVWNKQFDNYFVFITTDITKSAKEIVRIYELRPEIEEDYRQLKDFWKIEDFKSTKCKFRLI